MPFDICDGKNQYLPCKVCGATWGMGMVTNNNRLAVQCGECGHRGQEVLVPPANDPEWLSGCSNRDEQAFTYWNQDSI